VSLLLCGKLIFIPGQIMQRIKVLHITQSVGGVETYLKQVISTIDHSKYELKIVGTISENLEPYCIKYNVPFTRLKMARGLNPFLDIASIFSLTKILLKERAVCAHLHSAKGGFLGRLACKLAKQKSLYTPHALSYLSFTGFKRNLFFLLERFAGHFTYKLLAISHSEAERLVNDLGQKRGDIYVIPNSLVVESYFYSSFNNRSNLHTLQGAIKIGTIARLTPQKNPVLFIDIANEIIKKEGNRVHFYFLGVGEHDHLKEEVEARIKQYNIGNNIHLLERGDLKTSIHFLEQLDVFLFPSVFEGLSYALLEAMLQGVPCVVSNVDGNKDVIHNNINGFTCDTLKDFTAAISLLINDKQKAIAYGQAAKDYVLKYHDLHKNIHVLEKIYSEFVDMRY